MPRQRVNDRLQAAVVPPTIFNNDFMPSLAKGRIFMKKPVALIIMDGFGINESNYGNAVKAAKTPNLDRLFAMGSKTQIGASGMDVGLPDGQMEMCIRDRDCSFTSSFFPF